MTAVEQTEKYSERGREERQTVRQTETEIGKGLEAQTARDRKKHSGEQHYC